MANDFRIKSLSAQNYYSNEPDKLTGSCTIVHAGTSMELQLKLGPDEVTKMFAVVAGRVAEMMQETAINVARDLHVDVSNMLEASVNRQQAAIEAAKPQEVEEAEAEDVTEAYPVSEDYPVEEE